MPAADLDAAVDAWLHSLVECGPVSIRLQKKLIRDWEDLPLRAAVAAGIDSFATAWKGKEPRRMMDGFLKAREERRKAK